MNKINLYLFLLSSKYLIINLLLISIIIVFLNLIELSRILQNVDSNFGDYFYYSILKYPSLINEILPFATIVSISFLFRNLINNNELIAMRNIGYSIFNIFFPIALSVFLIGILFLVIVNPLSANFETKFKKILNNENQSLYSIKITKKQMWIKNKINENEFSYINIKNIDLKDMKAKNIKILMTDNASNIFIQAKDGYFSENFFQLNNVKYFDLEKENFSNIESFKLEINFNKENIINSIEDYKIIPFYKYLEHTSTLKKFNLYSPEISLYYLSEIFKPIFIVMLAFVIVGFSGKFKRNENFFKILFISILIGFTIFLLKEIITKMTLSLSINFIISYLIVFLIPMSIGLYQVIKIEND